MKNEQNLEDIKDFFDKHIFPVRLMLGGLEDMCSISGINAGDEIRESLNSLQRIKQKLNGEAHLT